MQITLDTPVASPVPAAPPAVASVQLLEADYSFTNATIFLVWNELDATGKLINAKTATLTQAETLTFFATPLAGQTTLLGVFQQAFLSAVAGLYGPGTISS